MVILFWKAWFQKNIPKCYIIQDLPGKLLEKVDKN